MKHFPSCIIPDAELAEYLKDKILIKPDCDASVGVMKIESDFAQVQKRLDGERRQNNDKIKRTHRLKGKK